VKEGYEAGRWTEWADCYKLIEDHDGRDRADEEGMEAFGIHLTDSDSEDDGESDGESDDDDDGAGGGHSAKGLSAKAVDADAGMGDGGELGPDGAGDDDGDGGLRGSGLEVVQHGGAEAAGHSSENGGLSAKADVDKSLALARARRMLYDEAMLTRNDVILRHMRNQIREETHNQKDAGTEAAAFLRKRAEEHSARDAKRRREAVAEERLAARDLEETKVIRAEKERATAELRVAGLKQIIVNRRDAEARKQAEVMEKAFQRWLQTQYPVVLAKRCRDTFRMMSSGSRRGLDTRVTSLLKDRVFARQLSIKNLWDSDNTLTVTWSQIQSLAGGPRRSVRCGLPFQEWVDAVAPRGIGVFRQDAVETLYRLFSACVPHARQVFTNAYVPLRLLHMNDYVLDKAFVYGIVALSKWMGEEWFPTGVYGQWPPAMPADLVPRFHGPVPIDVDTAAPSQEPPPPGLLPPHLRSSSKASASGGAAASSG
jgi:hypothetical protein